MKKLALALTFLLSALPLFAHRLEPVRTTTTVRQVLAGMGIDVCVDVATAECSPAAPLCVAESVELDRAMPASALVFYRCVDRSWAVPAVDGSVDAGRLADCSASPPRGSCAAGALCLAAGEVLYECRATSWSKSTRWIYDAEGAE